MAQAPEATIALCRQPVAGVRRSVDLPEANGSARHLVVTVGDSLPKDARCESTRLGFSVDDVVWLGAMSTTGLDDEARIALTVREPGEQIVTLEVDRPPAPAIRRVLPRAELLPFTNFRAFGSEERVTAQPDITAFDIACRPGKEVAGVVFDLGTASPVSALAVGLTVKASAGFHAQIVGRDLESTTQGYDVPSDDSATAELTLPVPSESDVSLIVTCPQAEGRLRLERGTVHAAAEARPLDRPSAWVWEPDVWRRHPAELLEVVSKLGVGRIYITVPIVADHVLEPERLAGFLAAAHLAGINVAAVEGDPDMIFGQGRAKALERARALAAYNANALPERRLDGVQYDIEPYFGPAFWARSDAAWRQWAETLRQLREAFGEPVDAVVPYWMLESRGASGALELAAPALNRLTIMAYRTEPSAIVAAAEPLLSWAGNHGLPTTVALESGTLAQENRKVYVKAVEGDMHVILFDDVAAVVILDRLRPGSTGRSYRLRHVVRGNPARVSFNNDSAAMLRTAGEVSPDLAAWPSIEGVAFHGLPEVTAVAVAALAETGRPQP